MERDTLKTTAAILAGCLTYTLILETAFPGSTPYAVFTQYLGLMMALIRQQGENDVEEEYDGLGIS